MLSTIPRDVVGYMISFMDLPTQWNFAASSAYAFRAWMYWTKHNSSAPNWVEVAVNVEHMPYTMIEYIIRSYKHRADVIFGRACANGRDDIVRWMLARYDFGIEGNNSAICAASAGNSSKVMRLLLDDGRFDPSACCGTPIGWACGEANVDIVRMLLDDPRVDPSVDSNYAIIKAADNGRIDVVKMLLADPRVDPSDRNNSAIRRARVRCDDDMMGLLLSDKRVREGLRACGQMISENNRI